MAAVSGPPTGSRRVTTPAARLWLLGRSRSPAVPFGSTRVMVPASSAVSISQVQRDRPGDLYRSTSRTSTSTRTRRFRSGSPGMDPIGPFWRPSTARTRRTAASISSRDRSRQMPRIRFVSSSINATNGRSVSIDSLSVSVMNPAAVPTINHSVTFTRGSSAAVRISEQPEHRRRRRADGLCPDRTDQRPGCTSNLNVGNPSGGPTRCRSHHGQRPDRRDPHGEASLADYQRGDPGGDVLQQLERPGCRQPVIESDGERRVPEQQRQPDHGQRCPYQRSAERGQ